MQRKIQIISLLIIATCLESKPKVSMQQNADQYSLEIAQTMGNLALNFKDFQQKLPQLETYTAFRKEMEQLIGKQIKVIEAQLKEFKKMGMNGELDRILKKLK